MIKLAALTVQGHDTIELAIAWLDQKTIKRLLDLMDKASQVEGIFADEVIYGVKVQDAGITFYDDPGDSLVIDDFEFWDDLMDLSEDWEGNHEPAAESITVRAHVSKMSDARVDAPYLVVSSDSVYWVASTRHSGDTLETAAISREALEGLLES